MEKSRTDLRKWFLAIWFISDSTRTKNAVQLKEILDVTYKTAWLMLSKLRAVLSSENQRIPLQNVVHISTGTYGRPYNPTIFKHRQEHPVLIGVATNEAGEPQHIQIKQLLKQFIRNRRPTPAGKQVFMEHHVKPGTENIHYSIGRFREKKSTLTYRFMKEASKWINQVFKGIGPKYLQSYFDEFCFRYHLQFTKQTAFPALIKLCVNSTDRPNAAA